MNRENGVKIGSNYVRWLYALVVLLTIIAAIYLSGWTYGVLQVLSNIVALYFFAWLLQFLFTPVVDFLTCRVHMSRLLAVSAVFLALGVAFGLFLYATIPAAITQGTNLAHTLGDPKTYKFISSITNGIESFLITHFHVPKSQIDKFTQGYSFNLHKGALSVGKSLQKLLQGFFNPANLGGSASTFLGFLSAISDLLLNLVIVLILAFYMMLDGHKLIRRMLAYFPPAVGEVMEGVHVIINRKFGGYLRSQIILALSYGFLTYLIAVGFNLQYSIFIGGFAAVMMLIPFIGVFVAMIPPLIGYALVHATNFSLLGFALLFIFLAVAQHVVLNLLAPRVMGSAMGMHPIVVLLGLLLGAKVAGLWGAIFGVPVFGAALDTVDLIYRRVMAQRYNFQPAQVDTVDTGAAPHPHHPPDGQGGEHAGEPARHASGHDDNKVPTLLRHPGRGSGRRPSARP